MRPAIYLVEDSLTVKARLLVAPGTLLHLILVMLPLPTLTGTTTHPLLSVTAPIPGTRLDDVQSSTKAQGTMCNKKLNQGMDTAMQVFTFKSQVCKPD